MSRQSVTALLALSLALSGAGAGAANAQARIACGDTLTTDTVLGTDLNCDGTALHVQPGVSLDLGGHLVRGNGTGVGIEIAPGLGGETTTVTNGRVSGWEWGLKYRPEFSVDARPSLKIAALQANSAPLWVEASAANIERSQLVDSDVHAWASQLTVSKSTLVRSGATGEMAHLRLLDSVVRGGYWGRDENETITIERSSLDGTGSNRAALWCWGHCTVRDSSIRHYARPAYVATALTAQNTVFADNPNGAITVDSGSTQINSGTFRNNGPAAVTVAGGEVNLTGSRFTSNGTGLLVSGGDVAVTDNIFTNNRGDGVRAEAPARFSGNLATRNGGWGIYAPGAVDGGANIARSNTAGNCFGLFCSTR